MHRYLVLLFFVAIASLMSAGAILDNATRAMLQREKSCTMSREGAELSPYISLILQVDDIDVATSLIDMGVIIWNHRNDMLLTSVPRERIEDVLDCKGILNCAGSIGASSNMNKARAFCKIDQVQQGYDLPMPYTGKGVVVGFSDIGFDAKHIAFEGRIKGFYAYDTANGAVRAATTSEEIDILGTDSPDNFHATHVANILAGGYMGNPYYGVAYGSEIVATTSKLDDVGILCGVEDIIRYAKTEGKRAVINLSLSTSTGPHDGSDLFCRYISLCGEDAVICISAGNTGHKNISASHLFENDEGIKRITVNNSKTWNGFQVSGLSDFWSKDCSPFSFRVEVYDNDDKAVVFATPWIGGVDEPDELVVCEESFPEWSKYMQGMIVAATGVSDLNGRFSASVVYETSTSTESSNGPWSRYMTSFAVKGKKGVSLDAFADAQNSYFGYVGGKEGLVPNSKLSINNMCTARNVVSVGACNTRNSAPNVNGGEIEWNFKLNEPAEFSSYGFGLPHFCAPGNYVVSATSQQYYQLNPNVTQSACSVVDGEKYYWFAECGTSMSAPFTAGTIAIWLEADPELTTEEIISIAQSTVKADVEDINNPKWGAGALDGYGGLKKVLSSPVIGEDERHPIVEINSDRRLEITMPGGTSPNKIILSSISGERLNPYARLEPGIYILKIDNCPAIKIAVGF